jgi:osmotically-inducible protein OsmY
MTPLATAAARRFVIALTASLVSLAGLSGCAPLVVGGVVAGAGMMATDRRSTGAQIEDQSIEFRGAARIRDIANDEMNVKVSSYNRQVLLVGTVGSEADRLRAEDDIRRMSNVRGIVNEIVVGPGSTFPERSNDTFVTGKVKAGLLDQSDIFANSFKVVTEAGVVYLMGIATRREVDRATAVARNTSGVRKVVRIVEVISEQELADLKAPRQQSTADSAGSSEGGTGSNSRVPLPPMEPLSPSSPEPASGAAVTKPVR